MERRTRQREAIRAAIVAAGRPLAPQEILDAAVPAVPGLGIATVYRALKDLAGSGEIVAVELPGSTVRYEAAGHGHHHHFHCRRCSRVFEVDGCVAGVEALAPAGFSVASHEILLYGDCADCSAGAKRRRR
ncbi:transcriptional repressor [Planctomycetota bacterium]|nr:transcriptional repressor [Planctomycetota bacterium]